MITNETRGTPLAQRITRCDTLLAKARGLMFSRGLQEGGCLLFSFSQPERPWIHMLFVFFPVDMLFLDKDGIVAHIVEARPFQLRIVPPVPVLTLIELPTGTIRKSGTREGDRVIIET